MDVIIPTIPAGVLALLSFFAPYAIAVVNSPRWSPSSKRLIAYAVSILLTLVVLVVYFALTGDAIPSWPVLVLIGLAVSQAAYLRLKGSVSQVERRFGVN